MNERNRLILETIVKEYIKSAQPVSSGVLVEKYKLDVSPATVRNKMMELEEEGYIFQPHTSSGRVPTELAYELIVKKIQDKKSGKLKEANTKILEDLFNYDEAALKKTAKKIAELSDGAVFWAFHKNDLYYTGLSNLFAQPEFKEVDAVQDFSVIIDRMEEIIDDIFEELKAGEQVLIGPKNPFGNFLSTVLVKYSKNNQTGIFGIVGPMRMDYGHNLALVRFIKNKFS